ncbi:DUF695 domain-containing protein [Massilia scottii]|uniref:DUF695 domain-containing protein n=1 Tax=Massilia scottii TaxID=3057166 RepID=UPI0027967363|nr:DUF695 domain-containing protein [Massilia sp. CCM 9029]MDQ1832297.1 DUF695 domain-containing protein [Massilia sp. CCM 9029]
MQQVTKHLPVTCLEEAGESWYRGLDSNASEYLLARVNLAAERWAAHPLLDIRLNVATLFNQANPGGKPDEQENSEVEMIGQKIYAYLKDAGPVLHVATFTTGILKEWVFYLGNRQAVPAIHEKIQSEIRSHDVECAGQSDPAWKEFAAILSKCHIRKNVHS